MDGRYDRCRLSLENVSSVNSVVVVWSTAGRLRRAGGRGRLRGAGGNLLSLTLGACACSRTCAQREGDVGGVGANHGPHVVGEVVGGVAVLLACRAIDDLAGWEGRETWSGWRNFRTLSPKGVAVNVRDIVEDIAARPSEFKLCDRTGERFRELD